MLTGRRDKPKWNGPPEKPATIIELGERERERSEERRGEERRKRRGALKATVCLGFLSPPAETDKYTTTRAPHEIHKPTGGTEIPVGGKIPSEIRQHSKSLRPEALPRARPESRKSLLKFPNPPWVAAAAAAASLRPTRLPVAAAAADFHPRCFVSLPLCYCRHELSRPARHRGPSRAREARGSLPRKSPLLERRPPLYRRLRALLVLEWRGGGDPPGRGSIPLRSVVFIIQCGRSIHRGAREVCFPKNSGGSTEPPCPTLSPPLAVEDWIGGSC